MLPCGLDDSRDAVRPGMMQAAQLDLPEDGRQSETAREVARGTRRLLRALGISTVAEMRLGDGRRADLVGVAPDGIITIVEIKSSIADLRADQKWPFYQAYCDRLFFAVPVTMPAAIMPSDAGLIVADAYGAEIVRHAEDQRLGSATRKAMLIRFARMAADRLHLLADPEAPS